MVQPKVVSLSPNRENIKYSVQVASIIEETFAPLVEGIMQTLTHSHGPCHYLSHLCMYDDSSCVYLSYIVIHTLYQICLIIMCTFIFIRHEAS